MASGSGSRSPSAARRVMVVADPSRESAGALQYALSHAVMENDTVILLQIENPNAWKNPFGALFKNPISPGGIRLSGGGDSSYSSSMAAVEGGGGGQVDFIGGMKQACSVAFPKLNVVVVKAEMTDGKDKASSILAQSEASNVDILIIGQRKPFSNAILGARRGLSLRGFDTADYVVENSKCTCVAVQKKGQNSGYLLNSKTHKNFWLLA